MSRADRTLADRADRDVATIGLRRQRRSSEHVQRVCDGHDRRRPRPFRRHCHGWRKRRQDKPDRQQGCGSQPIQAAHEREAVRLHDPPNISLNKCNAITPAPSRCALYAIHLTVRRRSLICWPLAMGPPVCIMALWCVCASCRRCWAASPCWRRHCRRLLMPGCPRLLLPITRIPPSARFVPSIARNARACRARRAQLAA